MERVAGQSRLPLDSPVPRRPHVTTERLERDAANQRSRRERGRDFLLHGFSGVREGGISDTRISFPRLLLCKIIRQTSIYIELVLVCCPVSHVVNILASGAVEWRTQAIGSNGPEIALR